MFNMFCVKMRAKWEIYIGRCTFRVEFYFKVPWKTDLCWKRHCEVLVCSEVMQLVLLFPTDVWWRQERKDFKHGLAHLLSHPFPQPPVLKPYLCLLTSFSCLQGCWKGPKICMSMTRKWWIPVVQRFEISQQMLPIHGGSWEKAVSHLNSPS